MRKILLNLVAGALSIGVLSGCAMKDCNIGSIYSSQHDKCVVTNSELKAVVSSVACVADKCKTTVTDERNREFTIDTDSKVKIGDEISLILYTKPLVDQTKK